MAQQEVVMNTHIFNTYLSFPFSFPHTFYFSQANLINNIASSLIHSKGGAGVLHPMLADGMPPSL